MNNIWFYFLSFSFIFFACFYFCVFWAKAFHRLYQSRGPLTADGCGKKWPNSSERKRLFPMGGGGRGGVADRQRQKKNMRGKLVRCEGKQLCESSSWGNVRSASLEWAWLLSLELRSPEGWEPFDFRQWRRSPLNTVNVRASGAEQRCVQKLEEGGGTPVVLKQSIFLKRLSLVIVSPTNSAWFLTAVFVLWIFLHSIPSPFPFPPASLSRSAPLPSVVLTP